MNTKRLTIHSWPISAGTWATYVAAASLLVACGGGTESPSAALDPKNLEVVPVYHRMPLALPAPDDASAGSSSAQQEPATVETPSDLADVPTQGLTDDKLKSLRLKSAPATDSGGQVTPAATTTISRVYTPAQIRAAYNLPPLPSSWTGLSAAQAADMGAGQTIFILDAYHHPKMVSDLNAFSAKFGLPACTAVSVSTSTMVLPPASTTDCTVSTLYSTSSGGMKSTAPAYNSSWAQEIALDTQWAHAIAPLARLVLIEAGAASLSELSGSIILANRMGQGVVSMSFAAAEGSWVTQAAYSSSLFSKSGMSYYAASGDSGTAVNWPAVAPTVVAVGGTTLNYSPTSRTETVWSGSGGGISAYMPMPAYQSGLILAGRPLASLNRRSVDDVAMNANPYTGVYVGFTTPTSTVISWYAFGGTSLATPMWAASVSLANAYRANNSRLTLSAPHSQLYASLSGNYASLFFDITSGANGTCLTCKAATLYDTPSGLGTPNASSVLPYLASW